MPDRSSKPTPVADTTNAESVGGGAEDRTAPKNPAAVALGRLGGRKGGPARARQLSGRRRSEIARIAAKARWKKVTED